MRGRAPRARSPRARSASWWSFSRAWCGASRGLVAGGDLSLGFTGVGGGICVVRARGWSVGCRLGLRVGGRLGLCVGCRLGLCVGGRLLRRIRAGLSLCVTVGGGGALLGASRFLDNRLL